MISLVSRSTPIFLPFDTVGRHRRVAVRGRAEVLAFGVVRVAAIAIAIALKAVALVVSIWKAA